MDADPAGGPGGCGPLETPTRDVVAARLRVGDYLPPEICTDGHSTLLIQLAWEDGLGWEVAQRLRPGEVLFRPVLDELAAMLS